MNREVAAAYAVQRIRTTFLGEKRDQSNSLALQFTLMSALGLMSRLPAIALARLYKPLTGGEEYWGVELDRNKGRKNLETHVANSYRIKRGRFRAYENKEAAEAAAAQINQIVNTLRQQ